MTTGTSPAETSGRRGKTWLVVLKWTLFALLAVFVSRRALQLWSDEQLTSIRFQPGWLVVSGTAYIAGWLPSVMFWKSLLNANGFRPTWRDVIRAYYCGHPGKYVPGKALVLVIRGAMLRGAGVPAVTAALTVTFETLATMGAGLVTGVLLLTFVIPQSAAESLPTILRLFVDRPVLSALVVAAGSLGLLPVAAAVMNRIAARTVQRQSGTESLVPVSTRTLLGGAFALAIGWLFHGISLAAAIAGSSSVDVSWSVLLSSAAAVAVATSVGFFAIFAPGGLGVREGLIVELLRWNPAIGGGAAIAAAVTLRLVWLVAELATAGVLYYAGTSAPPDSMSSEEMSG